MTLRRGDDPPRRAGCFSWQASYTSWRRPRRACDVLGPDHRLPARASEARDGRSCGTSGTRRRACPSACLAARALRDGTSRAERRIVLWTRALRCATARRARRSSHGEATTRTASGLRRDAAAVSGATPARMERSSSPAPAPRRAGAPSAPESRTAAPRARGRRSSRDARASRSLLGLRDEAHASSAIGRVDRPRAPSTRAGSSVCTTPRSSQLRGRELIERVARARRRGGPRHVRARPRPRASAARSARAAEELAIVVGDLARLVVLARGTSCTSIAAVVPTRSAVAGATSWLPWHADALRRGRACGSAFECGLCSKSAISSSWQRPHARPTDDASGGAAECAPWQPVHVGALRVALAGTPRRERSSPTSRTGRCARRTSPSASRRAWQPPQSFGDVRGGSPATAATRRDDVVLAVAHGAVRRVWCRPPRRAGRGGSG